MEQTESTAKQRIAIITGGLLTTLREVGEAPNGVCYAAAMGTIDFVTYSEIVAHLIGQGLLLCKNNKLSLTPDGVRVADRINARMGRV